MSGEEGKRQGSERRSMPTLVGNGQPGSRETLSYPLPESSIQLGRPANILLAKFVVRATSNLAFYDGGCGIAQCTRTLLV